MVRVRFTRNLERFFPGLDELEVPAETVAELVRALETARPGLAACLVDEHGALRKHVNVFVGEERIADRARLTDPLGPQANVFVIQAPVAAHPSDPDTAWVVPAVSDGQRDCGGSLAVCRTRDGGKTWTALRGGLPQEACFDLVYRHGMDIAGGRLAFASTTGNGWVSEDGGDSWQSLGSHFPPVYAVKFA